MTSGLRVAHARSKDPSAIARELAEQLGPEPGELRLVLFFAGSSIDFSSLAREVAAAFPGALTVGCTSCGEIGPDGCTMGKVAAFGFAAPARAQAVLLERLGELGYESQLDAIAGLIASLGATEAAAERPRTLAFLTLVDGLSGVEEKLLAAISQTAPKVPLVGGSAGDEFRFENTLVAVDGRAVTNGAAIVLLEPGCPFEPFHLHHYARDGEPFVVTGADPARRLVTRIDGYPALRFLARQLGIDEQLLRSDPVGTLGPRQVVFGFDVGRTTFMRSVMSVRDEGLLLGGALEEGALIYPMRGGDLVEETREGLARALDSVPDPEALLLFNCGGRMWEANTQRVVEQLAEAMLPIPGAGVTTYGEQFGSLQINHTLTGLVLGRRRNHDE